MIYVFMKGVKNSSILNTCLLSFTVKSLRTLMVLLLPTSTTYKGNTSEHQTKCYDTLYIRGI